MDRNARYNEVLDVLDVERIEENLYLGRNETRAGRLFGGQVLAQAARAAYNTVNGIHLHSLHGYFLRPGDVSKPVLYEVERIRDGRSFTTRRVVAVQSGQAIFNLDASFQLEEVGVDHAHSMPNVPLPEELSDDALLIAEMDDDPLLSPMARSVRPIEIRSVFQPGTDAWREARSFNPTWFRFPHDPDDPVVRRCVLAYASDMGLVSTASLPHLADRSELQLASLDHALWIHRDFTLDGWLLFHKRSTTAAGARGLVHADVFSESGMLIASLTQEGLMRVT